MRPQQLNACCLTPAGFIRGAIFWREGRITAVDGLIVDEARVRASGDAIVVPGFVDLHVHGGGGHDTMDGGDAAKHLARLHASHGTTAMLATTMTAPLGEIADALQALAPIHRRRASGAARVLGVHLEGPYISPDRLGAQPAHSRLPAWDEIQALNRIVPIKVITVAPEMPGCMALIPRMVRAGMRVQIGHSNAEYSTAVEAMSCGATSFTHLFNAMRPLHHREPGVVGAALAHGKQAELIPDLLHVHPGAMLAAMRAVPGLYAVTDATAAAGMPDGNYRLGRSTVTRCLGAVRLADGSLAGSTLTMDQAFRNLVDIGLSLAEASARTSTFACDYLGLHDRGRLEVGAAADFVVLEPGNLQIRKVIIEGEQLED